MFRNFNHVNHCNSSVLLGIIQNLWNSSGKLDKIIFAHLTFNNGIITLKFFSQNTTKHQFLMIFEKLIANNNEFIDMKIDTINLDKKDIDILYNLLSDKTINQKSKSLQNRKKRSKVLVNGAVRLTV